MIDLAFCCLADNSSPEPPADQEPANTDHQHATVHDGGQPSPASAAAAAADLERETWMTVPMPRTKAFMEDKPKEAEPKKVEFSQLGNSSQLYNVCNQE